MDQVERALLVASGDAASGKLVADSHVRHRCCTKCFLFCPPVVWSFDQLSGCLTNEMIRALIADAHGGIPAACSLCVSLPLVLIQV